MMDMINGILYWGFRDTQKRCPTTVQRLFAIFPFRQTSNFMCVSNCLAVVWGFVVVSGPWSVGLRCGCSMLRRGNECWAQHGRQPNFLCQLFPFWMHFLHYCWGCWSTTTVLIKSHGSGFFQMPSCLEAIALSTIRGRTTKLWILSKACCDYQLSTKMTHGIWVGSCTLKQVNRRQFSVKHYITRPTWKWYRQQTLMYTVEIITLS